MTATTKVGECLGGVGDPRRVLRRLRQGQASPQRPPVASSEAADGSISVGRDRRSLRDPRRPYLRLLVAAAASSVAGDGGGGLC